MREISNRAYTFSVAILAQIWKLCAQVRMPRDTSNQTVLNSLRRNVFEIACLERGARTAMASTVNATSRVLLNAMTGAEREALSSDEQTLAAWIDKDLVTSLLACPLSSNPIIMARVALQVELAPVPVEPQPLSTMSKSELSRKGFDEFVKQHRVELDAEVDQLRASKQIDEREKKVPIKLTNIIKQIA